MLHALNTRYYEGRDLAELWILRSLNYLKLCRFDEARIASSEFEKELKIHQPALVDFLKKAKDLKITQPRQILDIKGEAWILRVLASDSVIKKDLATEALVLAEKSKLSNLSLNLRIPDAELRTSTQKVLEQQLDKKLLSVSKALRPYVETRVSDILSEYKAQKDRLDFLKFEIYSQAQKYPNALERPEAKKQIQKAQFLPGVFLKGHEILWRYSGEHWYDELRSYDYFIPTECKSETI
jgi:Arc/MetJ family transcription regulator